MAEQLMTHGIKLLKSWFKSTDKQLDAADYFDRAGNLYKIEQKRIEASSAYEKSAECYIEARQNYDAASAYIKAAHCLDEKDPKSINLIILAARLYSEIGNFKSAADIYKDLSNIYSRDQEFNTAVAYMDEAIRLYDGENMKNSIISCEREKAYMLAKDQQYQQAAELFEKIARDYANDHILKFISVDMLTNAAICNLAFDTMATKKALSRYQSIDYKFEVSAHCKFIDDLLEASNAGDLESFTDIIAEYDALYRLDQWKCSALLRLKTRISSDDSIL